MAHLMCSVGRRAAPVWLAVGLGFAPAALVGQSGANERILVLPPVPAADADSALAVAVGNQLRDRLGSKYRFDFRIIPTSTICEALEASGFQCGLVPPANAPALARFLQASGYMTGWLERTGDSLAITLRMVDQGRSGLSGWLRIAVRGDRSAEDVARRVADDLQDHVDAAQRARQCTESRERSDFRGARRRADQAFQEIPNHPAASMCMALVAEATQAPPDSIIVFLRMATQGDSLNARAWEMLGRRLQQRGDSTGALDAFVQQLHAEPNDLRLRLGVAAGLIQQGQYARAVGLLDEALASNPAESQVLRLKERACLDGSLWECALEALSAQYENDSTLVGDSIFYAKAFGAAQSANDTAGMLRWSSEGVSRLPNSVDMWRARASALRTGGEPGEALQAYRRVIALDSTQIGAALAASQILLDTARMVIDSTRPLDTATLMLADTLLQLVAAQSQDPATRMNIAVLYLNPGLRLVNQRMRFPLASRFLEQAIAHDVQNRISTQASFFLGLAYFFQIFPLDQRVRETQSCELVDEEIDLVRRTREALERGKSVSPQAVDNLMQNVRQVEQALPTYKPAFQCQGA